MDIGVALGAKDARRIIGEGIRSKISDMDTADFQKLAGKVVELVSKKKIS